MTRGKEMESSDPKNPPDEGTDFEEENISGKF